MKLNVTAYVIASSVSWNRFDTSAVFMQLFFMKISCEKLLTRYLSFKSKAGLVKKVSFVVWLQILLIGAGEYTTCVFMLFDMLAQMTMVPMIQDRTQPYFTGAPLYTKTHMRTHLKLKYGMLLSQI